MAGAPVKKSKHCQALWKLAFNDDDDDAYDPIYPIVSSTIYKFKLPSADWLLEPNYDFQSLFLNSHIESPPTLRYANVSPPKQKYTYKVLTDAHWYKLFLTEGDVRDNTFEASIYRASMFQANFRLDFDKVSELVDIFIAKQWITKTKRMNSCFLLKIKTELLILGCLHILAHSSPFQIVSANVNMSPSTVRRFFHVFIAEMYSIKNEYISMPSNLDEARKVMGECASLKFPGCLGSIDVVHCNWDSCPSGDYNLYKGKEKYPSIAWEVVVKHNRRIMSVSQPYAGTFNDQHIVKIDSTVIDLLPTGSWLDSLHFQMVDKYGATMIHKGPYFICDNGYLEWPQLMNPLPGGALNTKEKNYSKLIESVRKDVECCFGILKKRWKIIKHALRYRHVRYCDRIFVTCCILHNMMVDRVDYPGNYNQDNPLGPSAAGGVWLSSSSRQLGKRYNLKKQGKLWMERRDSLIEHINYKNRRR